MVVYEKLFPVNDGMFCITLPHPGYAAEEYRDTTAMYAFYETASGERKNLFELCTLPWPADKERAAMTKQMLNGMQMGMDQMPASQRKHMESSVVKFTEQLKWLERDTRKLPERVSVTADGKVLLAFKKLQGLSSPPQRVLRLIDVQQGKVLVDETIGGGGGFLGFGKGKAEVAEMLAISGNGQTALLCEPRKGVYAINLAKGLPQVFSPVVANADFNYAAWAPGHWLINTDIMKRDRIIVLDEKSGKQQHDISLGGTLSDICVSANGSSVACGLMGGAVVTIALDSGDKMTYKPHRGAKRESWPQVVLSPDGHYLASWLLGEKGLVLTDANSGRSMRWLPLESYIERDTPETASMTHPSFGFSDSQLTTLVRGNIQRYDIPALDSSSFVSQLDHPEFKKPVKYNKNKSLEENLARFGLTRVASEIASYWSPGVILKLKRAGKKALPPGSSRLGGEPDLPQNTPWPQWSGNAMNFIAQFKLEEVATAQPDNLLPKTGLLSLFMGIDAGDAILGMPESKGMLKMIWTPPDVSLQRQTMPTVPEDLEPFAGYDEAAISYKAGGYVLPKEDSYLIEALNLSPEELENYLDLIQQLNKEIPEGQPAHQLLGHPLALQSNDMEMACARAIAGEDPFTVSLPDDPQFTEWLQRAAGWQLLLQLDSDEENSNLLWGDAGLNYWFIQHADLMQQKFDAIWVQMQCH